MFYFRIACFFIMAGFALYGCSNSDEILNPVEQNLNPVILEITANPTAVQVGGNSVISAQATDPDGDNLTYSWTVTAGRISGEGAGITWTAPPIPGIDTVTVEVSDGKNGKTSKSISIRVQQIADTGNSNPVITTITASADTSKDGDTVRITVSASDADDDSLTFTWNKTGGTLLGNDSSVQWIAPAQTGTYTISVSVSDGRGGSAVSSKAAVVISDNAAPVIHSLDANPSSVGMGGNVTLTVSASDPDGDILIYTWESGIADSGTGDYGIFNGSGSSVTWTAPVGAPCCVPGPYQIIVTVKDGKDGTASKATTVQVTE